MKSNNENPEVRPPENPESKPLAASADPFDVDRLRLSQDFGADLGVEKALLTVPVRKPSKEWFIRVHPDDGYQLNTAVLELKEDREIYLIDADVRSHLAAESTVSARALFTTMNRQGVLAIWPIRLPGTDGRTDEWSRSALEAASIAKERWVRVQANMSLGAYDVLLATADLPEPTWPDKPFKEILEIAFRDRFIDSVEHPVLRRLRGDA